MFIAAVKWLTEVVRLQFLLELAYCLL